MPSVYLPFSNPRTDMHRYPPRVDVGQVGNFLTFSTDPLPIGVSTGPVSLQDVEVTHRRASSQEMRTNTDEIVLGTGRFLIVLRVADVQTNVELIDPWSVGYGLRCKSTGAALIGGQIQALVEDRDNYFAMVEGPEVLDLFVFEEHGLVKRTIMPNRPIAGDVHIGFQVLIERVDLKPEQEKHSPPVTERGGVRSGHAPQNR